MSEHKFSPGTRVQVDRRDPHHHNRVPAYIRGSTGVVKFYGGSWKLADLIAQGIPCDPEPVYCVEFEAQDLFGDGSHHITVDIWESWLSEKDKK
ncbi:SH3-like domain-containing protein [Arthrobacter sp. NPDC093139]|uniref:SH3-like domain-containing protein n=1 Tax=Arthrobacter sp. NPDC093139 TaxID=3363945 RepID=UPI00381DD3E0